MSGSRSYYYSISDILHLFGQGNCNFIGEKSKKSQAILKRDVCGKHVDKSPHIKGGMETLWKVLHNSFEAFITLLCFLYMLIRFLCTTI